MTYSASNASAGEIGNASVEYVTGSCFCPSAYTFTEIVSGPSKKSGLYSKGAALALLGSSGSGIDA